MKKECCLPLPQVVKIDVCGTIVFILYFCLTAASFGGIVGLCLGSSLISLVEMIYFFTIRPACSMMRQDAVTPITVVKERNNMILPPPYDWLP